MFDQSFSDIESTESQPDAMRTIMVDGIELDQRQTLAYQEWLRLCRHGKPPLQRDFRPDRIARTLPSTMLLHVQRQDDDIRFVQRLEGRLVIHAFGEGMGQDIEKIYTDSHLDAMLPRYLESAMTGDAGMTRCRAWGHDDQPFDFTRLILPFLGQDEVVNRLLVTFHFDPVSLARLPCPLNVRRENKGAAGQPITSFGHGSFGERRFG